MYRAIAYYQTDDTLNAAEALKEAYKLACGNGLIMPFIEFGHKTRPMLAYFRENGHDSIPPEWLKVVHTKASTYAKHRAFIISQQKRSGGEAQIDYGLSPRETELLQNMSKGLTRDETAALMYISSHTVKSMLKTVYSKLGAANGSDAVRIAGAAGLI